MGRDDDERPRGGEVAERLDDGAGAGAVELCGGLVDQHQVGGGGHRAGEHEALRLTAGQVGELAFRELGEPEQAQHAVGLSFRVRALQAVGEVGQHDVVDGGAVGDPERVLEHPGQARTGWPGDRAGRRGQPTGDEREQGGLPRAARTHDRGHLTGLEVGVQAGEQWWRPGEVVTEVGQD